MPTIQYMDINGQGYDLYSNGAAYIAGTGINIDPTGVISADPTYVNPVINNMVTQVEHSVQVLQTELNDLELSLDSTNTVVNTLQGDLQDAITDLTDAIDTAKQEAITDAAIRVENLANTLWDESDHLNVLHFGVKNDGTNASGNTQIINDLISQYGSDVDEERKTIYFPDGNYVLGHRAGQPADAPILCVSHAKPINFLLSPNAKLSAPTATNPDLLDRVNGIIEIGESDAGVSGVDGMPPVIIHGGIIDCTNVNIGIICWSGRPLVRIEDVSFQNINIRRDTPEASRPIYGAALVLGKSPTKGSGDTKVINCTFNGISSKNNNRAIWIESNDNEINNVRINGCKEGIRQQGGTTYYNDVHMTVTSSKSTMQMADFNNTVGMDLVSGNAFLNGVYFDTFANALILHTAAQIVNCVNCIWYDYQDNAAITYKNIIIANDGFPLTGHLSLVNCSMNHKRDGDTHASYNYIFLDGWGATGATNRVYNLFDSSAIKIVDCEFDFIDVNPFDIARNVCFSNKPITVRPDSVTMTLNSYYPIARICRTPFATYKLEFDLVATAAGEILFTYTNDGLSILNKNIWVRNNANTFLELAFVNTENYQLGADTTQWTYLCLKANTTGKRLQGTYDFGRNRGAVYRITPVEYGGGSATDYKSPGNMYSAITATTVLETITIATT